MKKCDFIGHKWGEPKYIPPYQINGEGSFSAEGVEKCIRCNKSRRKTVEPRNKIEGPYTVTWITGEYDENQRALINGVEFQHNEEVLTEYYGKIGTVTLLCRYGDNKDGRIWKLMDGDYYSQPMDNFKWAIKKKQLKQ